MTGMQEGSTQNIPQNGQTKALSLYSLSRLHSTFLTKNPNCHEILSRRPNILPSLCLSLAPLFVIDDILFAHAVSPRDVCELWLLLFHC